MKHITSNEPLGKHVVGNRLRVSELSTYTELRVGTSRSIGLRASACIREGIEQLLPTIRYMPLTRLFNGYRNLLAAPHCV